MSRRSLSARWSAILCVIAFIHVSMALDIMLDDRTQVVSNDVTKPNWAKNDPSEIFSAMESEAVFILYSGGENFSPPNVTIVFPDFVSVSLEGDAQYGFDNTVDEPVFSDDDGLLLRVVHRCHQSGRSTVFISLEVYQTNTSPVSAAEAEKTTKVGTRTLVQFGWVKICNNTNLFDEFVDGKRDGFRVGVTPKGTEVVNNGVTNEAWRLPNPKVTYHAEDHSASFYLSLAKGMGTQLYKGATAHSPDWLNVIIRSEASLQNIANDKETHELLLLFECAGPSDGDALVTITLDVELFEPITWAFYKNCGGSKRNGLIVSSRADKQGDVALDGVVEKKWAPDNPGFTANIGEFFTTFWVSTSAKTLRISRPIVTASPAGIMKPSVTGDLSSGGYVDDSLQDVVISYNCLQKGVAHVTLTIPVPMYKSIEFSWTKQCVRRKPQSSDSSSNFLLYLLIFGVAVASCAVIVRKQRKKRLALIE